MSAEQIAQDKIILPNPDVAATANAARRMVSSFGTLENINNYVRAHLACGKYIERLDDGKDEKEISNTLGVMQVLESLISQAIVGADKVTIIRLK